MSTYTMHNPVEGNEEHVIPFSKRAHFYTTPLLSCIIYHIRNIPVYIHYAQSGGGEGRTNHPALKVGP